MTTAQLPPVIPAKAGIPVLEGNDIPACAGMTVKWAMLVPILLAGCQREAAPAENNQAAAPAAAPKAAQPESEVARAERLVRDQVGAGAALTFTPPQRTLSDGVPILCGEYAQGDERQRYIVVNNERAFVEPRMRAGEMDRAFVEFCGGERG